MSKLQNNINYPTDADEDFDSDNLSNLGEYQNKTKPFNPDTDNDGFLDGDEIFTYGTDPLNPDTDNDGLLDGEESYNGSIYAKYGIYFDPLNPDTNGNGILDGDEVFGQSKRQEVETHDEAITEVNVDMDTNGNLEKNLTIKSMYNIDAMSTNVYAMIGEPFNFTSSTDFESATITFKVDQSKLGDTLFDNLIILWYNEEDQIFEEMPTARDAVNSTVSTTTTHFSQYMVVDSVKWYANWNNSLNELRKMWIGNTSYQKNLHTILMLDCSSSMASSDYYTHVLKVGYNGVTEENIEHIRNSISSQWDAEHYCVKWCDRFEISENLINSKGNSDVIGIITFADAVQYDSGLSYKPAYLKGILNNVINNDGGTAYLNSALAAAQSHIETNTNDIYRIVVITDNNITFDSISSDDFSNNTIFNIINVGSSPIGYGIEEVAKATGGDVYNAISANDLTYESGGMVYVPPQFIGEDSDGDGIPDLVELYGLKPNGEPINTNPYDTDTDGDGIPDNIELQYAGEQLSYGMNIAQYITSMHCVSDPTNPDTDGDFDIDGIDPHPTKRLLNDCFIDKIASLEQLAYEYTDNNPSHVSGDKYMLGRQYWLITMFIRQFDLGYVNALWPQAGGEIDYEFVKYVKNNDISLYNYFQNQKHIYADYNKELVDVKHLAATMSVYLYITDKEDTKFNVNYNHYIKNLAFSFAQTQLPEVIYDCLGGWAGDLQTLMNDTMKSINQIDDYELFYGMLYGLMGDSSASFSMPDLYADTDAYNISLIISLSSYYSNEGFAKAFADYYTDGYTKRFTLFTNGLSEEKYGEIVRLFTDNYLNLGIEIFGKTQEKTLKKKWPLLKYHFSNDQSQAASDAYTAFIFDRVYGET